MAKVSIDIVVPIVGKTMNLLIPSNIECEELIEMVEQFSEDRFHIKSEGELYSVKNGKMINRKGNFGILGDEVGLQFILM